MNRQEVGYGALAGALVIAGIVVGIVSDNVAVAAGLVAAGTALVIFYQSYQTRKAAEATQADALASTKMLAEIQRDRELGVQPVLVLLQASPEPVAIPVALAPVVMVSEAPAVQVQNVGRGPAIGLRIVKWHAGEIFWSEPVTIAPGQTVPAQLERDSGVGLGMVRQWLYLGEGHEGFTAVDPRLAQRDKPNDLVAYCLDLLGNGLRFRLRVGEPPTVWHPASEVEPPWAPALKEPFDWRPANLRASLPFDEVSQP